MANIINKEESYAMLGVYLMSIISWGVVFRKLYTKMD